MAQSFSVERINAALQRTAFGDKLHHFTCADSTNARALADAQAGAIGGQVYIADEQTAGRGRGGHAWYSEPEDGLYLTVLARPALQAADALKLSLAAGVAALLAINAVTAWPVDLRWPNDLVSQRRQEKSRKLGGILTESASTPSGVMRHAAIGIGINLNQLQFPPELADTATSLRLEGGEPVSREALAIALLQHLDTELDALRSEGGQRALMRRFAELSSWVHGKHVSVAEDGGYTGVTAGLTDAGLLRIRCQDGQERTVRHGGVREL